MRKRQFKKGDKKLINGWAMYDWANSVYSLVIVSTIFPVYYSHLTSAADNSSQLVSFLGFQIDNVSLYTYALSASFLISAALAPLLSAIADYTGNKKAFMRFFCYLGSLSCITLFFFSGPELINLGIICFMLASIGFTGSIVFYNAYLPEIADVKDQDAVSAKGFALGYLGSVLLLLFNLSMIQFPAFYHITNTSLAPRISFLTVGLWWMGFAQFAFSRLPRNVYGRKPDRKVISKGYIELIKVFRQLKDLPRLKRFLMAFFFYSMGIQTIMYMAPIFADKEMQMDTSLLIATILLIQLVAMAGAYLFSRASATWGNLKTLSVAVLFWTIVTFSIYWIFDIPSFIVAAFAIGLVMGGTQALSRSTYSKLLPETQDHASFFSFYDVCEKISIVLGSGTYGLIYAQTGNMRDSVIFIITAFVIGFIFLRLIPPVLGSKKSVIGEA